jgi:hypothetical protein
MEFYVLLTTVIHMVILVVYHLFIAAYARFQTPWPRAARLYVIYANRSRVSTQAMCAQGDVVWSNAKRPMVIKHIDIVHK